MAQGTDLTNHISALVKADASLVGKLNKQWFYVNTSAATLPAVLVDKLFLTDDKQDSWRFNLSYVTNDTSLAGMDAAQQLKTAIQQSHCIVAQSITVQPEPENKRVRYVISCTAYLRLL